MVVDKKHLSSIQHQSVSRTVINFTPMKSPSFFTKHIPPHLLFLLFVYLLELFVFSAFRFALLIYCADQMNDACVPFLPDALFLGFRFDSMITCYLLLFPFLLLSVSYLFDIRKQWIYRLLSIYFVLVLTLELLICAADIPYFKFFNARLTSAVFLWANNFKDMMAFVFSDVSFYPFILLFVFGSWLFVWITLRVQKFFFQKENAFYDGRFKKAIIFILSATLLFWGLRGGNKLKPLSIREAFFTNYSFVNQLCINPVNSYVDSYQAFKLNYLENDAAINQAKKWLGATSSAFDSPVAREVAFPEPAVKANVVLIMMESMSADRMQHFGCKKNITPYLDSLMEVSLSFTNMYTAGIHTHNGIYGTLFSFPSLMNEHPMANVQSSNQLFAGMPGTLKNNGYQTLFFCTHEEEFDNMGYFLRNNGMEQIYSRKDYPPNQTVNNWGVSDEYLFEFAFNKLNESSHKKEPFFATILTISTHPPQELPKNTLFKPKSNDVFDQVYEYADWAIADFMKKAAAQDWYNNTVFLFIADHGVNLESSYDMPLSFNHSPFIIYAPWLIKKAESINRPGLQMDVFPTLMGLLRIPYINNTMGIDLVKETRPYAYFCQGDKLGCLNERYFLIKRKSGSESLYDYRNGIVKDCLSEHLSLVDSMRTYTYSMLQTTQWILDNRKAGPPQKK